jgi:hypothetical protein
MDTQVTRLHRALVTALQSRTFVPGQPVTVAEIYQELIPYRSVRSALGFALNADYEHTLLELLAGRGDLARIEPPEVREHLVNELESTNPNVGVFHNYAACDVYVVVPESMRVSAPAPGNGKTEKHAPASSNGPTQKIGHSWESVLQANNPVDETAAVRAFAAAQEAKPAASERTSTRVCVACQAALPAGREVHFCPFCGQDQSLRNCPKCQTKLEPGWRFCVGCGASVA